MDIDVLKRCLKVLNLSLSGRGSKRRTQARAVGKSQRTITRYRRLIEEALSQRGVARAMRAGPKLDERPGREAYLHRLARCAKLLKLEHSGPRTTVQALCERFGVDKRTIFRDLELVEEAIGRPLTLVRRRAKR